MADQLKCRYEYYKETTFRKRSLLIFWCWSLVIRGGSVLSESVSQKLSPKVINLFKVTHLSVAKKIFKATCLDMYTKSYFQCYNFYRRLSIFSAHCKLIAATTTAPLLQTQRNAQVHWYSNLQELNLGIKGAEWNDLKYT